MRGLAIAAAVGATASSLLYLGLRFGVDMYFRAMGWRDRRREKRTA